LLRKRTHFSDDNRGSSGSGRRISETV
jgi:hypothetical protein